MTPIKSPRQEVFQTPLTFVRAISLAHLVAVQTSEILKIFDFPKILKIPELWTATKCAKTIVLTNVRGVLKTS